MVPRKPNHRVYPRIASRRRAIFKKTLVMHSERCFFTFKNKWSFPDLFTEAYFWLEKCEHEARSCTCHSPRTVLAAASIFAMLVLYQLLLKCTKCQYGELTVSLLFSAQENTRHAHHASVSRNLTYVHKNLYK